MRKLLYISLTALLTLACAKDIPVTEPCNYDIKLDWVKGSKIRFTVTPDNQGAFYCYGLLSANQEQASWPDSRILEWQIGLMRELVEIRQKEDGFVASLTDMFCFKGTRTYTITRLADDSDFILLLFQINPLSLEPVGSLYRVPFKTRTIPDKNLTFTIRPHGSGFTITPSDLTRTWFWEYETEERIFYAYGSPYSFYYEIMNMYEEYNFLENMLSRGEDDWDFERGDDNSIKEGVRYTLVAAGCEDGDFTSDLHFASFEYKDGVVTFYENEETDIPIIL